MRVTGVLSALLLGTTVAIVQPVAIALTPKEISEIAQQITVRIDGANTGSGVIIERQGDIYTVVTNWHVVQLEGNYTVQTPDGKRYTFNNSQVKRFSGVDLAVFQFTSNANYRVAEKGNSDQVALGTNISVAGYPQGTSDIDFRRGAISRLVTNPKDGYAFVYDIGGFPGMSGGAILDEQGKLVGIHGRATTRPDTNATTVLGIPLKTYLQLTGFSTKFSPAVTKNPSQQRTKISSASTNFVFWKTLQGHFLPITSITFSPNGQTLASGSRDMSIRLWNVATGTVKRTLQGHSERIDSVAYSPDGKILASGSDDETIKLWDVATGIIKFTLQGSFFSVHSVTFKPDGKVLASGSDDGKIKLWDVATGTEILTLQGDSFKVSSVVFSPDGKTLVSGNTHGTIKLWNVVTGTEIKTIEGHSDRVDSIAFSPDGKTFASGSWDNTIKVWNVVTGMEIYTFQNNASYVTSVAFSPDGKTLARGSIDSTIKLWSMATGKEIRTINSDSSITSLNFSPDGKTLASGSTDNTIKLWRLSE
ncbi:trypsin-like peptidase domain-containing protein [Nostoc punctiforme FACHB-252]|uniref:Trypsin-like peptidase domain-containing protein n=1 Tax=Nostoc punctiforme FACHB-252 TaxID=1357509 RepID=A0ABR8H9C5_NOSPU|nr:trypsin-like peptidase domain-containing protein [Nostoc punctiforme]MBD2611881.1 trypsin-like peptidase domain-containing protein [Nostoc punctiforme FACHB-252]